VFLGIFYRFINMLLWPDPKTPLKEFNPPSADKCLNGQKERIRRYRRYVYEAGAVNRPEKGKTKVIGYGA
jgi:hypothetical protein